MSRSLPQYLHLINSYDKLLGLPFVMFVHAIFTYSTSKDNELYIKQKYTYCTNGFTNFMIIDSAGLHYKVNNSLWYLKFNSIEDWAKIEPNDTIKIKEYGYRIPCFGIFPNIVKTEIIIK